MPAASACIGGKQHALGNRCPAGKFDAVGPFSDGLDLGNRLLARPRVLRWVCSAGELMLEVGRGETLPSASRT